ncbi:hypothetical protein BDR05DRAFT_951217 [Suillus weaverae]|nr:hypothetical protein BDR05DRAFT_951217 [Suillus weaverae]
MQRVGIMWGGLTSGAEFQRSQKCGCESQNIHPKWGLISLCIVVDLPHLLELEDITNRLPVTTALSGEVIIHLHLLVAQQLTGAISCIHEDRDQILSMEGPTSHCPALVSAICCLSCRLNWWIFANPQHLIGPIQTLSGPQPVYLDQTPPLLTRGNREFKQYQDSVRDMLCLPFTCQFCGMGGLLWQLIIQYGPDNLILAALSGPSSNAYMHSNSELISTDIDDTVKDAHIKMLLGVTIDGHSLWPPIDVFEKQMQWEGE